MRLDGMAIIDDVTGIKLKRSLKDSDSHEDFEFETVEPVDAASDLADAQFVIQTMANAIGFSRPVVELWGGIIAFIGLSENFSDPTPDEVIAEHLNCSRRSIVRWRDKHIPETKERNCTFIEIAEGDHDRVKKRTEAASYRVPPEVVQAVNSAVEKARSKPYYHDSQYARRKALTEAAYDALDLLPDARIKERGKSAQRQPPTAEKYMRCTANNAALAAEKVESMSDLEIEMRQAELLEYFTQSMISHSKMAEALGISLEQLLETIKLQSQNQSEPDSGKQFDDVLAEARSTCDNLSQAGDCVIEEHAETKSSKNLGNSRNTNLPCDNLSQGNGQRRAFLEGYREADEEIKNKTSQPNSYTEPYEWEEIIE